jgi:hypothetical protein
MSTNILLALGGVIGLYFASAGYWPIGVVCLIVGFILDQKLKIGWYDIIPGLHVNGVFDGKPLIEDTRSRIGVPYKQPKVIKGSLNDLRKAVGLKPKKGKKYEQ